MFSQFLLYKIMFVLELLVAEHIFLWHTKKRRHFALRVITGSLSLLLVTLIPIDANNPLILIGLFLSFLTLSTFVQWLAYEERYSTIIFFSLIAYCVQFTAYAIDNVFVALSGIKSNVFGVYSDEAILEGGLDANYVFAYIIELFIYASTYYLYFLFFALNIDKYGNTKIDNKFLVVMSGITLVLSVVINAFVVFYVKEKLALVLTEGYSILFCITIVYMMFSALQKKEAEENLKLMTELLQKAKTNYELSKKNIDMINIKIHDLKHQIHSIGEKNTISQEAIAEIEDTVSIYDSQIDTGNNALNLILTERSLYCYKNKIKLTCIADGKLLDFMEETEIYALFGNLIENSTHAVRKVEDESKRYIGLSVQKVKGFVAINIHNFFEGEVEFDQYGLPRTTKKDKENHGFGFKSINYIVNKYEGTLSVSADNHLFTVDIVFPIA